MRKEFTKSTLWIVAIFIFLSACSKNRCEFDNTINLNDSPYRTIRPNDIQSDSIEIVSLETNHESSFYRADLSYILNEPRFA